MSVKQYPVIDLAATGQNIIQLRQQKGLTVRDLQNFFGFQEPQAIYKWQQGKCLPTVDNLCALGVLLEEPIEHILVLKGTGHNKEPWAEAHGSLHIQLLSSGIKRRNLLPLFKTAVFLFLRRKGERLFCRRRGSVAIFLWGGVIM